MAGTEQLVGRLGPQVRTAPAVMARLRRLARRHVIRTARDRTQARDVLAALDLWPRDHRDHPGRADAH